MGIFFAIGYSTSTPAVLRCRTEARAPRCACLLQPGIAHTALLVVFVFVYAFVFARAARSCKILLRNRLETAQPAGLPALDNTGI